MLMGHGAPSTRRSKIMKNDQKRKMLKELVMEIDYDIYKNLFEEPEEPEEAEQTVKSLLATIDKYLGFK